MDNLPPEIALEIFSRLTVDTVLDCQRVCKTWQNLLSDDRKTNFAALHLLRQTQNHHNNAGIAGSSKVSLLFIVKSLSRKPKATTCHPLYYLEFDENNTDRNAQHCIQSALRRISHPLVHTRREFGKSSLVSSCNGLICLVEIGKKVIKDPVHICNPITREYIRLPGFNKDGEYESVTVIHSGFGYCSRSSGYKVVRILCSCEPIAVGHIQVYTLGAGSGWRNKGVITESLASLYGVVFKGALHWLCSNKNDIMVFDLSDECFHVLPARPFLEPNYNFTSIVGSFGEWLCVSGCIKSYYCKSLDIWTFKKTLSKGSIAATDNKGVESWSWCKEFSVTIERFSAYNYRPFTVTKSGLILLKYKSTHAQELYCCDSKTASTAKQLELCNFIEVMPHTNSFVSLKALGETTSKKRKRRPGLSSGAEGLAR